MTSIDPTDTETTAAFEALRREVSLARAAVEGLTAARERMPDYSATLAQIIEGLKATAATAARIEKSPAVSVSPEAFRAELAKTGEVARHADMLTIRSASDGLARGCGQLNLMIKRGQAARKGWRERAWFAGSGLLAGILLWSFLPGTIARAMPSDYALPERMAAGLIGTDLWTAGLRMMASAKSNEWHRTENTIQVDPRQVGRFGEGYDTEKHQHTKN